MELGVGRFGIDEQDLLHARDSTIGRELGAPVMPLGAAGKHFDEEDREPSYGGWNPAAVTYWRKVLHRRPITKGLVYPTLPPEVTHAIEIPHKPLFQPAAAAGVATARPHFRPTRR